MFQIRVDTSELANQQERNVMTTARELTPEEVAAYRAAARRRGEQEQRELALREKRAWALARRAATLLREEFEAERVVVFGSLVHTSCFTPWSDVDIAAWGIDPQDTFRAIGIVMDMDADIELNLVDVGTCSLSLRTTIEREGVAL
jgi:predicted nucleotidyltransferase